MFKKIMIDSNDSVADKNDLTGCRRSLNEAKQQLVKLRDDMFTHWEGNAKNVYYDAINTYIAEIDSLLEKNLKAMQWLDTIANTYRDADAALVP